jgi:hypothetical protein
MSARRQGELRVSVQDQPWMRPGEGGGRNGVAAQLVFQSGRGVTEQTARVACGGFSIEVWSAGLPSELRMMPSAAWTEVLRKNALSVAGLAMIESENPVSRDEEDGPGQRGGVSRAVGCGRAIGIGDGKDRVRLGRHHGLDQGRIVRGGPDRAGLPRCLPSLACSHAGTSWTVFSSSLRRSPGGPGSREGIRGVALAVTGGGTTGRT